MRIRPGPPGKPGATLIKSKNTENTKLKRRNFKKAAAGIAAALLIAVESTFFSSSFSLSATRQSYWPIHNALAAAVSAGDDDAYLAEVEKLKALYAPPLDADEYSQLAFPLQTAAKICERRGNYSQAAEYYRGCLECVNWLNANGQNYYDLIKTLKALIAHNSLTGGVYTVSQTPYFNAGAKNEPAAGTYFGTCDEFTEGKQSAFLLYVNFFTEEAEQFSYLLPESNDYLLEVAWNAPNESWDDLKRIASGSADDYIIRNLKYLSTLRVPVLIRFAAEVNCWLSLPASAADRQAFAADYRSAFIRVAELARTYAPDAAMIFSPNEISNWYVSPADFYPGDAYVDWVGMSTYMNRSSAASGSVGNDNDAFYCRGAYDNQMVKIKEVIDLYGSKKPIIISECGFCYSSGDGLQNPTYAAKKLKEFYTYVNMVYPQVKAVLYFNTQFGANTYTLNGNSTVLSAYNEATAANLPMQSLLSGKAVSYRPLDGAPVSGSGNTLYTYADFPGDSPITVTYTLNGTVLPSSASAPYSCKLGAGAGGTLTVTVSCQNTRNEYCYEVTPGGSFRAVDAAGASAPKPAEQPENREEVTAAEPIQPIQPIPASSPQNAGQDQNPENALSDTESTKAAVESEKMTEEETASVSSAPEAEENATEKTEKSEESIETEKTEEPAEGSVSEESSADESKNTNDPEGTSDAPDETSENRSADENGNGTKLSAGEIAEIIAAAVIFAGGTAAFIDSVRKEKEKEWQSI